MDHVLAFDCETTGATNGTKGNPFTPDNRLVCSGTFSNVGESEFRLLDYRNVPYGPLLGTFQTAVDAADLLVGFNTKFDLHWKRRYGVTFRNKNLWDVQLAYFIMTYQRNPFPALSDVSAHYGLPEGKDETIRTEYWEKSIDTDQVPVDVLESRVVQDAKLTYQLYELQEEELKHKPQMRKLIWLACQDLMVLEEMEWNGLTYDIARSQELADKTAARMLELQKELDQLVAPPCDINWGSNDDVSACLFGGKLEVRVKERYDFTYKDGRVKEKERWTTREYELPRILQPLEGSERDKEGFFHVGADVLQNLRPGDARGKQIIANLLEIGKLERTQSTYLLGLPKRIEQMGWENNTLHPSITGVRTGTGRLASRDPNGQNMDKRVLECLKSRY